MFGNSHKVSIDRQASGEKVKKTTSIVYCECFSFLALVLNAFMCSYFLFHFNYAE